MEIIYSLSKTFTVKENAITVIGYVTQIDESNYITTIRPRRTDVRSYAYDNAGEAIERVDLLVKWETDMIERMQSLSSEEE